MELEIEEARDNFGRIHKQGMNLLETAANEGNCETSKLTHDLVTFCALKALESRAKGKFDHKRTGTEQTNGKGMNSLHNFVEEVRPY